MMQWQDIGSAPKDGTAVLVWGVEEDEWEDAHDEPRAALYRPYPAYFSSQGLWWLEGGAMRMIKGVTHWMPLPDAPQSLAV